MPVCLVRVRTRLTWEPPRRRPVKCPVWAKPRAPAPFRWTRRVDRRFERVSVERCRFVHHSLAVSQDMCNADCAQGPHRRGHAFHLFARVRMTGGKIGVTTTIAQGSEGVVKTLGTTTSCTRCSGRVGHGRSGRASGGTDCAPGGGYDQASARPARTGDTGCVLAHRAEFSPFRAARSDCAGCHAPRGIGCLG